MLLSVNMYDSVISKEADYDMILKKVNCWNEIDDKKRLLIEKSADYLNTALQMRY